MKKSLLEFWVIPGFFLSFLLPNLEITNYISVLALLIVLFDVSSRFKIKHHDHHLEKGLKLTLISLGLSLIILTPILSNFFAIMLSLFLAAILSLDEKEGGFIIAFFALILSSVNIESFILAFTSIQNLLLGVGTGLIVGIVFLKYMREFYHEHLSPLALLVIVISSYLFATLLGGNGFISVLTLGFMFGNVYIKNKKSLEEFSKSLSKVIEVAAFITLGFVAKLSINIIAISLLIYALILIIRFASIKIINHGTFIAQKSILFVALGLLYNDIAGIVLIILILNKILSLFIKNPELNSFLAKKSVVRK